MNTNFQTFHQMGSAISDFVKQATGRDNVQNIDMEHITVAQNHYYEDVDVSGHAVVFSAGAEGIPFEKCVVQIEPVQDLHGYDHPWPAGGGKNLFDPAYRTVTVNNIRYYQAENKTFSAGTYTLSCDRVIAGIYVMTGKTAIASKYDTESLTFTITEDTPLYFNFYNTRGIDENMTCQLEVGSSATPYEPYANICPITGWTMVNVYQAGQSSEDVRTFRFTFPSEAGIVYGGHVDLVEGKLVVDKANIASYNGETLPGEWISDRDVYKEGTTPTTGAQVVYELAEPLEYALSSPEAITTLKGINHIWADTGDIEVKFTDLKELY